MTFDTEKVKSGRRPAYMVDLLLDYCDLTYGSAPCTAAIGVTGSVKCFNTRLTCQDPANYTPSAKTYRFVQAREGFPPGFQRVSSLRSVSFSPTMIDEDGGLGQRAMVTLEFQDHPHHDRGIDKYVGERTYTPENQGTFWSKLRARNPYYKGRILRLWEGYLTEPFDVGNFRSRDFVIDSISQPDPSGRVRVVAKDILKLADGEKAVWPPVTTGTLAEAVDKTSATIEVSPGDGPQYDGFQYVAIGDEIIKYTGRTGDTLTGCVHGQGGTLIDSHDAGEKVQVCADYAAANVVDIVRDLLTDPAGVPASYINDTEWNDERDNSLKTFNLTTIIASPTPVRDLIQELLRQCLIVVWQDDVDAMIKLKSLTPWVESEATLTDSQIIAGSMSIQDMPDRRISRVRVYHGMRNYLEDLDKAKSYRKLFLSVDTESEADDKHGEIAEVVFHSRWFLASDVRPPTLLGSRLLDRYNEIPQGIAFALDARHASFRAGAVVDISTRMLVDAEGANKTFRALILREQPDGQGHQYRYQGIIFPEVPDPVIDLNQDGFDVDIYTLLSAPVDPVSVTVNVLASTTIATSTGTPAIDSGPMPAGSDITLVVGKSGAEAVIHGCGGAGGVGGTAVAEFEPPVDWIVNDFPGGAGAAGGPAVKSNVDITIDNTNGYIFGGGGGGAGGHGYAEEGLGHGGGGGGGGRSSIPVVGGRGAGPYIYAELASIFEDAAGQIAKSNPFTNENSGLVEFYAVNDRYTVEYSGPIAALITGVAVADNVDADVSPPWGGITDQPAWSDDGTGAQASADSVGLRATGYLQENGGVHVGLPGGPHLDSQPAIQATTGRLRVDQAVEGSAAFPVDTLDSVRIHADAGDLSEQNTADWDIYVSGRPVYLTDSRIPGAIDASSILLTDVPVDHAAANLPALDTGSGRLRVDQAVEGSAAFPVDTLDSVRIHSDAGDLSELDQADTPDIVPRAIDATRVGYQAIDNDLLNPVGQTGTFKGSDDPNNYVDGGGTWIQGTHEGGGFGFELAASTTNSAAAEVQLNNADGAPGILSPCREGDVIVLSSYVERSGAGFWSGTGYLTFRFFDKDGNQVGSSELKDFDLSDWDDTTPALLQRLSSPAPNGAMYYMCGLRMATNVSHTGGGSRSFYFLRNKAGILYNSNRVSPQVGASSNNAVQSDNVLSSDDQGNGQSTIDITAGNRRSGNRPASWPSGSAGTVANDDTYYVKAYFGNGIENEATDFGASTDPAFATNSDDGVYIGKIPVPASGNGSGSNPDDIEP